MLTFLSRITSQLMIVPKRLKMSSRSSLRVTGLSLQTKRMFSGGRTSAKGKSPTISSVRAAALESAFRLSSSISSGGLSTPSVISSEASNPIEASCSGVGEGVREGMSRPSSGSNGSSGRRGDQ